MFTKFGDYNIMKDTKNSFFIEFYAYDPVTLPEMSIDNFIEKVME